MKTSDYKRYKELEKRFRCFDVGEIAEECYKLIPQYGFSKAWYATEMERYCDVLKEAGWSNVEIAEDKRYGELYSRFNGASDNYMEKWRQLEDIKEYLRLKQLHEAENRLKEKRKIDVELDNIKHHPGKQLQITL